MPSCILPLHFTSARTSGILHSVGNTWIESSGDNICIDLAKIEKYAGGGWGERGGGGGQVFHAGLAATQIGCHKHYIFLTESDERKYE